jgi:hypothetical protein
MPASDRSAVPGGLSGRRAASAHAAILMLGLALAGCGALGAQNTAAGTTNPRQALQAARQAVQAQDGTKAAAALDRAEQDWLAGNNAIGNPELAQAPAVLREIGNARAAVRLQRWGDAVHYIDAALSHPSAAIPE